MDSISFLVLMLAIAGFALVPALIRTYHNIKEAIRIRRTPTYNITALPPEGLVEVVGKAEQNNSNSPITQTACVFWQVQVEELQSSGKSSHWVTIYKNISDEPFDINDGTGEVHILPTGAELILRDNLNESSSLLNHLDPQIKDAVGRLGVDTTGWLGLEKSLRVHERTIGADEQIFVLGEINYESGIKTIKSQGDGSLIVSDCSERETLSTLYGRIGQNVFFIVLAMALLIYVYFKYRLPNF